VNTELPADGPNGEPQAGLDPEAIHKPSDVAEAEKNHDEHSMHTTPKTGAQAGDSHLNGGSIRGGTSPLFDPQGETRTLQTHSPWHSHSKEHGGTRGDNPPSNHVTPQASHPQGTPPGKFADVADNVPDSLGGHDHQRPLLRPLGTDPETDTPLTAEREGNAELLPRQRLSDVDQLQYQQREE
jgi:hypothetical protein